MMSEKMRVETNASIFIIPNRACKLGGFLEYARDGRREFATKMMNDNGKIYNESEDYFVQTWLHSKELNCDNMQDHGFTIYYEGSKYYIAPGNIPSYIMRPLIDVKECETFTITFKDIKAIKINEERLLDEERLCDLVLNVTANQLDYRYSRFGRFEDVLKYVCR